MGLLSEWQQRAVFYEEVSSDMAMLTCFGASEGRATMLDSDTGFAQV